MKRTVSNKQQTEVFLIAFVASLINFSASAVPTQQPIFSNIRNSHSLDGSWQNAIIHTSSPKQICRTVQEKIEYRRDMYDEDEWRSAKDTWDQRAGDCEDIAETVRHLCELNGLHAEILVFYSETARQTHAVTIGKANGRVWVSSNGDYRDFDSFYDAKQEVARDLGWHAPSVKVYKVVKKANTSESAAISQYAPGSDSPRPELMPYESNKGRIMQLPHMPANRYR